MNFSRWTNFAAVLFLFVVIHESSAVPDNYLRIIFRARQAEARRNRLKYKPYTEGENRVNPTYTGFVVTGGFNDFVWPTLSADGKLLQEFKKEDNDFFLTCRKNTFPTKWIRQKTALNYLKSGKQYYYAPIIRTAGRGNTYVMRPTPLSEYEKRLSATNQLRFEYCNNTPMPGIFLDMKYRTFKRSNVITEYSYGEDGEFKCSYMNFEIDIIEAENEGSENFNTKVKDGKWLTLFHLCYDKNRSVTAFTRHEIQSRSLVNRKLNPNLDLSDKEKAFVRASMSDFYNLDNQRRSFELQKKDFPKELDAFAEDSNYLVRTHLVPDHDTLYESWQYVTNNYLNYAPMWRAVNLGQWLKVEQDIRHMAMKYQKKLVVYTGVYYSKKKIVSRLYLTAQKRKEEDASTSKPKLPLESIPIPSLFFKYVHGETAGIVLITANGASGSVNDIPCINVCKEYGWLYNNDSYSHRNRPEFGETKCCTPRNFFSQSGLKEFIPDSPISKNSPITKVLTYGGKPKDPPESDLKKGSKKKAPAPARNEYHEPDSTTDGQTIVMNPETFIPPSYTAPYLIGQDLIP